MTGRTARGGARPATWLSQDRTSPSKSVGGYLNVGQPLGFVAVGVSDVDSDPSQSDCECGRALSRRL
eukprot:2913608-Rhodomonas_salina.1